MDDCDMETMVFMSLGEASTCWIPSTGDAVFDSMRAEAIGNRLLAKIRERITGDRTDELIAERDRLQAQLRDLMTRSADAIDLMNIEYGCPDCGVHHACGEVVAERDRLQAIVDGCPRCGQRILLTPESLDEETTDDLGAVKAERDLLWTRLHALAGKCDRLDERRHELHDLLTAVEAERDRLQAELAQGREEHKITWADWKRQRKRAETAEAERDRLRAVVEAALEVVRPMADSACDADVLRIADLYRILAGPALDVSAEATDG